MNKITISSLDKVNIFNTKEVEFLGTNILIKDYLSMEDKLDLAELVLQNSVEYGFINDIKMEVYFNVYAVVKYTNLDLIKYLEEDIFNLYDLIEKTGLIQLVVDHTDYSLLYDYTVELIKKYENYQTTFAGVIDRTLNDLPDKLSSALNELDQLDTSKLVQVFDKAVELGGNENAIINTIVGGQK